MKAHANFNPETDARTLRDAMKGFGEHNARIHALHQEHTSVHLEIISKWYQYLVVASTNKSNYT